MTPRESRYLPLVIIATILLGALRFWTMCGPIMEDPFNINGRHLYKDYYLHKFEEGGEPLYYLWKRYGELPRIPFEENVTNIIREGDHVMYLRIDRSWYRVDMDSDKIAETFVPPALLPYAEQPDAFWRKL